MPHLESLLQAGSVAVVGARDDTSTYGGRAWTYLTRAFQGTATAVNARSGAVRSRRCLATLAEVDPAPEVVVLATPADTVIGLLEQAGAMGTSAAVIFSTDLFGSEEEISVVARRFGMSVLGPNCLGLINTNAGVVLSSSISLERPSRPGPLAFVSQSGALMGLLHARSIDLGLGMGLCVSTGSQAVLRAEDFLLELAGRDDIGAVGVYLESIDVARFTAAAQALAQRDIRLVALRAGSTPAGSRAATAHSGALAGSGAAFTALAADLDVAVVDGPGELLTTLALASTKGRRWHITTSSGGMAAIAADQATAVGVELPPVRAGLGTSPGGQTRMNPTDLDAEAATTRQKLELIAELAGEPGLDGVLVVVSDMPFADRFTRELAQVVVGSPGRVFAVSECSQQLAPVWDEWVAAGLAYLPGLAPALRAIGRLHGRTSRRGHDLDRGRALGGSESGPVRGAQLIAPGEVQALLREAGLPVLPAREADSAQEATSAAKSLGYPVVLKVSRALHRGSGGVRLGLGDASEVAAAYRELAAHGPVLVQRQSAPGLECYIGVRADPVFGRLLLLGTGGPGVEELADVVIGRGPLEPGQIRQLIASTRFARWLASPASRALFDIESLVPIAEGALRVLAELPGLESLDLNPVVVTKAGAVVVDAKATSGWPGSAPPQLGAATVRPGHREVPAWHRIGTHEKEGALVTDDQPPDQARVALVTGSARGMGREHALALSRAGWGVALIDLLGEQLRDVQAEIRDLGGQAMSYPGDITADGFARAVTDDVSSWGTVAGLVNNAGIGSPPIPVAELSVDQFRSMFEVHVLGSVRCITAVMPHMRAGGFGRIVNIASYCAVTGSIGYAHYCTAKAGLIGLTRCLAREVAGSGITVNAIAPGLIETPMTAADPEEVRAGAIRGIPVGRYGRPGEVAGMVRYLLSAEAAFVTGQVMHVNGGMVMA